MATDQDEGGNMEQDTATQIVYQQATTGVLHLVKSCSITRRTRYEHFPVEFTQERQDECPRCHKCWDAFTPKAS